MGLFTYTVAGAAFILIGGWETLISAAESQTKTTPSQSPPSPKSPQTSSFSSMVTFLLISVTSLLFILNSVISLSDAVTRKDNTGLVLQLEIIAIALLFLFYSLLGILSNTLFSFHLPLNLLNVIYAFGFGEEFLLFYTRSKDPSGVENRYYDLILVPIAVCLFATVLEVKCPKSSYTRLGRGVGLVLKGMWTMQMGFSFYSKLISNGCDLHERSRGNYTVRCKGHPEYHRGRAVASLQFNCHLAVLITLGVGLYSVFCKKYGVSREYRRYKPLGEMQFDENSRFTLDSDDGNDGDEIKEIGSVEMQKGIVSVPVSAVNGNGSHG